MRSVGIGREEQQLAAVGGPADVELRARRRVRQAVQPGAVAVDDPDVVVDAGRISQEGDVVPVRRETRLEVTEAAGRRLRDLLARCSVQLLSEEGRRAADAPR